MGRPKRCASKPKPYIKYGITTTTTTTTVEPIDYSDYIVIPESGADCPITTTTTTTTTIQPFDGCRSYQINGTGYIFKYIDCQNEIEKVIFDCSNRTLCASKFPPKILLDIIGDAELIDLHTSCGEY